MAALGQLTGSIVETTTFPFDTGTGTTNQVYADNYTWGTWLATTTTTDSSQLRNQTWCDWQAYTDIGTNTLTAWVTWTNGRVGGLNRNQAVVSNAAPRVVSTREQLIIKRRAEVRKLRERVAKRKAEALLLEHLDTVQAQEWRANRRFHVDTPSGSQFLIREGRAGNVELVRGHEPRAHVTYRRPRYCCHLVPYVPDADNVLVQKLMLEADEEGFLRMANVC